MHETVQELVDSLSSIQPRNEVTPLHYLVLDATGDCVIVEFLDGEPMLTRNSTFPGLTNSTYQGCLLRAETAQPGRTTQSRSSQARFETLHQLHPAFTEQKVETAQAMAALAEVSQGEVNDEAFPSNRADQSTVTAWSYLFRPHSQSIQFATNRNRKEIDLKHIRFDAAADCLAMDVHAGDEGDITALLEPYEVEANRRIVESSASLFQMPQSEQDALVNLVDAIYRTRQMQL